MPDHDPPAEEPEGTRLKPPKEEKEQERRRSDRIRLLATAVDSARLIWEVFKAL